MEGKINQKYKIMKEDIDLSRNRNTINEKYVSESHARRNPNTTVKERDSINKGTSSIIQRFRDARSGHYVSKAFKSENPTTTQGESDRVSRRDKAFSFLEDIYATRTAKEATKKFNETESFDEVGKKFGKEGIRKSFNLKIGKRKK